MSYRIGVGRGRPGSAEVAARRAAAAAGGAGWYVVQRHGGRARDRWRPIAGGSFEAALASYEVVRAELRQGAARLVAPDGEVVASCSAPRLRSRW